MCVKCHEIIIRVVVVRWMSEGQGADVIEAEMRLVRSLRLECRSPGNEIAETYSYRGGV